MSGPDPIELEQAGRVLRGSGTLRVSPGMPGQGGWLRTPIVAGVVTFDERVTLHDVEAMSDATARVTPARGGAHRFAGATVMNPTGGPAYEIRLECHGAAS